MQYVRRAGKLPDESLNLTLFFSLSSMATEHGVEKWSEEHWKLIEAYGRLMRRMHQNVFWVTWDTVKVTPRADGGFDFDFANCERLIDLYLKLGFTTIEGAPVFGRVHYEDSEFSVEDTPMGELRDVKSAVKPTEILLVVDSMTGQDAVNVADTFNKNLGIDGVILTKLDGDTRGGAAISVKAVTGKPIKFSGTGEKLTDLEPFHPDRMASRILGMGDVLSLIEKAQDTFDEKNAAELERKMRTQTFDLNDYLKQMQQMKKMGSFEDILKMIPGIGNKLAEIKIDEKKMGRIQAIIQSMTMEERRNPDILGASRKRRIAAGSGTTVQEINLLLKQFDQSRQLMKQMMGRGKRGRMRIPFSK